MQSHLDKNNFCINNDRIYFLNYINHNLYLIIMKLIDNSFTITKEITIIREKEDKMLENFDTFKIICNNDKIVLYNDFFYLLNDKI